MRQPRRAPRLTVQSLEAREVPANLPLVAFGADAGSPARVHVYKGVGATQPFDFEAFHGGFPGGVRVAVGDVTGDGQDDVVAATGDGRATVKVFNGVNMVPVRSFYGGPTAVPTDALRPTPTAGYAGGLTVAVGDLNGDGKLEIVTACDRGPGTVSVFDGRTGARLRSFTPSIRGRVAVGDTDGDGTAEILFGSATAGAVRVYDGRTFARELLVATADPEAGGVTVAAADVDGDGTAEVIVGSGSGDTLTAFDGRTGETLLTRTVAGAHGLRVAGGVISEDGMADVMVGSATDGSWSTYDGPGTPLGAGTEAGFPAGVWVARSARQELVNRHAAQVVLDWNAAALAAIKATAATPPAASRALAILQTAVYDAVNGIVKAGPKYRVVRAAPVGAALPAAVARAAHDVLVSLFPLQKAGFDTRLTAGLARLPERQAKYDGVEWGRKVAADLLAARANDGSATAADRPYTPGNAPGDWRPTPPANLAALLPGWGDVKTFGIGGAGPFVPPPPPDLTGTRFAADYNEVKALGPKDHSTRTADQTEVANFWADGPGTFTPPGHWNAVAADLVAADALGLFAAARVFARLDVALADAAIVCWEAKFRYRFWRPVTAIRSADFGNPNTAADPAWAPLLTTPPFPEYMSGHSAFSGAAATVLAAAFGAQRGFAVRSSDGLITRTYRNFRAAADEAGRSRVYGGIHFQFSNLAGLAAGRAVGAKVLKDVL